MKTYRSKVFIISCTIVCIKLLQYLIPDSQVLWHSILQHFYVLPIVGAALCFGWWGGLLSATLTGCCLAPNILLTYRLRPPDYLAGQIAEIADFILAGVITGLLADRERWQKRQLLKNTERLSAVYRELQDNFERMKRSERL